MRQHSFSSKTIATQNNKGRRPRAALSLNLELPGNDKPAGGFSIVEWQNTEPGSLLLPKIEGCVDRVSIK